MKLPQNLTCVESQAFLNCTSLQNIQLPEGLERIGVRAFNNCPWLKNINIPDSVLWIGNNAFYESGCVVTDELGIEYVDDWIVGGGIESTYTSLDLVGVSGIADNAFKGNERIEKVVLYEGTRL